MPIPRHPADANTTALAQFIAAMPGGDYVGDAWRTEPMVYVVVRLEHADFVERNLAMVATAYPPHPDVTFHEDGDDYSGTTDIIGSLLFCVPGTVAKVLRWHVDAPNVSVDVPIPAAVAKGYDLADLAPRIARVWRYEPDGPDSTEERSVEQAIERWEAAQAAARQAGVDPAAVFDTAATLWADSDGEADFTACVRAGVELARP